MRTPAWMGATDGSRWRRPALVAASVSVHALVLGFMALQTVDENRRYGSGVVEEPNFPYPPILIEIEPRPLLRGETPRPPTAPRPEGYPRSLTGRITDTASTAPAGAEERPTPPAPRLAAPVEGAPASPADMEAAWRVRPPTFGDRVGQGLRGGIVGCAFEGVLTPAQQAVCDDRLAAREPGGTITGTGNPERDAAFAAEGARALARYERRRRPLAGGVGVVGPQDGPGSNFGAGVAGAHLDPSLRPDSTENIRTYQREGPRD